MPVSNVVKKLVVGLIRAYQVYLSPLYGRRCRYHPTCSAYAITAIQRFGFFRGIRLAGWRILRCNPFTPGGIDDVPEVGGFIDVDGVKKWEF